MGNTKALEAARKVCRIAKTQEDIEAIIQAAIDEATTELRTQLAERDAQLEALQAWIIDYVPENTEGREAELNILNAIQSPRQPTQDKGAE